MKPGPRSTPTPLLKLVGSREPLRNRRDEPQPQEGRPSKPQWLKGDAAKVWPKVIAQLDAMGVLTKADGHAIARYCKLLVRWVDNNAFIEKYGETHPLKDKEGGVKCMIPWPQVSILNQLSNQILRLEQEFGLTPSSRASLKVEPRSKISKVPTRKRKA